MPTQLVKPLGQQLPAHADGQRRAGPFRLRGIRRVAAQPGNSVHYIVQVIIGFQLGISHRPVISHPVLRLQPKVRRMKAGKVGTPMDCAASHGVIHQRRDWRFLLPHRVILRQAAQVGIGVKVRLPMQLGVRLLGGKGVQWYPAALLQAHHLNARLRQAPGKSRPGSPGSNNQNIRHFFSLSHSALLKTLPSVTRPVAAVGRLCLLASLSHYPMATPIRKPGPALVPPRSFPSTPVTSAQTPPLPPARRRRTSSPARTARPAAPSHAAG